MAVTLKKIDETLVELKRFYSTLYAAKANILEKKKLERIAIAKVEMETGFAGDYTGYVSTACSPKESGAAMRASMDLSRKLAEFRKS